MDFSKLEQFTKSGSRMSKNTIAITKNFSFMFHGGFYNRAEMKKYEFIVLFYNKEENIIAFLLTNNENIEGKYRITHSNKKTSASFTGRAFFFSSQLNEKINNKEIIGKYEPKEDKHPIFGKIYYIELNKKLK